MSVKKPQVYPGKERECVCLREREGGEEIDRQTYRQTERHRDVKQMLSHSQIIFLSFEKVKQNLDISSLDLLGKRWN